MSIKELYNKQMEANQVFNKTIDDIRKSSDKYTVAEINKRIEEKQKEFNSAAEVTGTEIVNALNAFRKEKNYNTVAIDNPAFTTLLQAVQVFGDSIPKALIDTAVLKLKNEQGTLMAVKTLLQANKIAPHVDGVLNELIVENILIDRAINEAEKYGTSKPVELGNVMQVANAIERLENFSLSEHQANTSESRFYL